MFCPPWRFSCNCLKMYTVSVDQFYKHLRGIVLRVMLLMLMLAVGDASLFADIKRRGEEGEKKNKRPIVVPEVKAVNAHFIAGESVEIELVAVVATLRPVDFIIRANPEHGTLSEIRRHPREANRAFVTYTHASKTAPTVDSFTYACRVDNGPYSAPGRVTLVGQKYDPVLRVEKQPAFNRIFAGGVTESVMVLENVGAAPYEGPLQWQPPFHGPSMVTVMPGSKVELKVSFRPEKAGHYHVDVPLVGNRKDGVINLYGDSIPALTVSPGRMVLKFEGENRERTAILTLGNGKPEETEVKIKLPLRLKGTNVVKLAPQGREDLKIYLPANDVEAFHEEIEIEADGVVEKVLVTAEAQPAHLVLVSPSQRTVDLGTLEQRAPSEQEFIIGNTGGQDLLATLSVLPPFSIEETGETIRLQPGQERRFLVKLDTRAAGFFESNVEATGSSQKVSFKIRATVKGMEPKPQPQPQFKPKPKPSTLADNGKKTSVLNAGELKPEELKPKLPSGMGNEPVKAPVREETPKAPVATKPTELAADAKLAMLKAVLATKGVEMERVKINPNLEQVREVTVSGLTQSNILLSWPQPKVKTSKWRVEAANNGIKPEDGMMVKFWEPISNWQPVENSNAKGMVTVNIDSLKPGAQYEFRVFGVDEEGRVSRPSPSILVTTLPAWRVPAWLWRTLILGSLGTLLYLLYRVKRGDFEFEH